MRLSAHRGPLPIRKTAISNPIVAFNPDRSTLPKFVNVRDPHLTVCYIDQGDPSGALTNNFVSRINVQPRTVQVTPVIAPSTKKGPLLMFKLEDDWYSKFAEFMIQTLAKSGITAGLGHPDPHVSLAYADMGTLEALWQQYDLDNWQGVTMNGPFTYDATGVQMQDQQMVASAPVDSSDWLEVALLTVAW